MKIYTRSGDKGTTGLAGGQRVSKDHIRVDAYGTIDELNAFLGLLMASLPATESELGQVLGTIQQQMFDIGSELARVSEGQSGSTWQVTADWVTALEQHIDRYGDPLPPLRNFILPGGSNLAALCHVVRTVARRAERKLVGLAREEAVNPHTLGYINRLSDLFFVLARYLLQKEGGREVLWVKASDR